MRVWITGLIAPLLSLLTMCQTVCPLFERQCLCSDISDAKGHRICVSKTETENLMVCDDVLNGETDAPSCKQQSLFNCACFYGWVATICLTLKLFKVVKFRGEGKASRWEKREKRDRNSIPLLRKETWINSPALSPLKFKHIINYIFALIESILCEFKSHQSKDARKVFYCSKV